MLSHHLWSVVCAAKQAQKIEVGFYTSGNRWAEADIDAALTSGLDWVTFSIDGVRKEVFEHYRVAANLKRVLGTLCTLAAEEDRLAAAPWWSGTQLERLTRSEAGTRGR